MCSVLMSSTMFDSICNAPGLGLGSSTSMLMQVPRLLLMVSHDCVLVVISILPTESRLLAYRQLDHFTTSETTTVQMHSMCPVCPDWVLLVDAVSVHASLVFITRWVLFETLKKVEAIGMSAPAGYNKGTGSKHLGARVTHEGLDRIAKRAGLEEGVTTGQMISSGKYFRSSTERE